MKKIIGVALILVVVLFALPFVVRQAQDTGQDPQPTAQEEAALPDSGHTLRVKGSDGQVTEMDLNQYLWGVVAAEMPASFEAEALKAQTYLCPEQGPFLQPSRRGSVHRLCLLPGLDCPGQGPGQLGGQGGGVHQ